MPNWCHNTLTVSGDPQHVQRFVELARPSEASGREAWQSIRPADGKRRPPFKRFYAEFVAESPLSFSSLVPEPSEAEYAAMDEAVKETCRLCGGRGKRPVTAEEAAELGIEFYPNVVEPAPLEERRDCNGCSGSGRAIPVGRESWYAWRLGHWGTKWDASFSDPFVALGTSETADVAASVEAKGATTTPEIATYRFDTAWSPPVAFLQGASARCPDVELTLRYGEPGGDFAGQLKALAGEILEDESLDVDDVLAPEEMWF